jgi:hypothetical protein
LFLTSAFSRREAFGSKGILDKCMLFVYPLFFQSIPPVSTKAQQFEHNARAYPRFVVEVYYAK